MPVLNRRKALAALGLAGGSAALPARAAAPAVSFEHGVASGDPLADRMILWTRVTPADPGARPVSVGWIVAEDEGLTQVVAKGQAQTGPDRDFTVKVDAAGLKPARDYWYRFTVGETASPTGRARTLPVGQVKDVVLAVASCSLYPAGYFNAYNAIAALPRVDAVLHLGDYIYEYGGGPADYGVAAAARTGRLPQPAHEIVTLADYRTRHAQYKSDPDLQAAHARAPWICVWDDHETANDSWIGGAENHQPDKDGDWAARKAAALKAYYEWMPIREARAGALPEAINRSFRFGEVAELFMVETRLTARSQQMDYEHADLSTPAALQAFMDRRAAPDRELLGPAQQAWLAEGLARSVKGGCAWQVLGNQVVMAQVKGPDLKAALAPAEWDAFIGGLPAGLRPMVSKMGELFARGVPMNLDAWDGYPAARERVYDAIKAANASALVLAGDSHAFWVNDLHDAGGRRVAAEFGTTGITSPGWGDFFPKLEMGEMIARQNDEVVYSHQSAKGFILLTLTPQAAKGELIAVSTIASREYRPEVLKTYVLERRAGGVGAPAQA